MNDVKRFTTSGTLDAAFFKEHAKYMLGPKFRRKRMLLAALVTALCVLDYIWTRSTSFLWILAIYWITYHPFTLWYRHSAVKTLTRRFCETYADGKCDVTTSCTEEGVLCENHSAGGAVTVKYEHLHTMAVAERAFILMSQAGQFNVVFRNCLTEQEQKDLQAYLLKKSPELKIIR